jgi:hypothetical protein
MDIETIRSIAFHLRSASDFMREHAILRREGIQSDTSYLLAHNNLKIAATDMGFDLVKREEPARLEAAE